MDFIKKHKKLLLISTMVLFGIGLTVWLYKRNSKETATGSASNTTSAESELKSKIQKKMDEIKAFPEWYDGIKKDYAKQGMTLTQAVANAAIWGLKHDGIIPIDTYGAGEWGHTAYVKANY